MIADYHYQRLEDEGKRLRQYRLMLERLLDTLTALRLGVRPGSVRMRRIE